MIRKYDALLLEKVDSFTHSALLSSLTEKLDDRKPSEKRRTEHIGNVPENRFSMTTSLDPIRSSIKEAIATVNRSNPWVCFCFFLYCFFFHFSLTFPWSCKSAVFTTLPHVTDVQKTKYRTPIESTILCCQVRAGDMLKDRRLFLALPIANSRRQRDRCQRRASGRPSRGLDIVILFLIKRN